MYLTFLIRCIHRKIIVYHKFFSQIDAQVNENCDGRIVAMLSGLHHHQPHGDTTRSNVLAQTNVFFVCELARMLSSPLHCTVDLSNAVSEPQCRCCCQCLASCRHALNCWWTSLPQHGSEERHRHWRWRRGECGGSLGRGLMELLCFENATKIQPQATVSRPRLRSPGRLRQAHQPLPEPRLMPWLVQPQKCCLQTMAPMLAEIQRPSNTTSWTISPPTPSPS